MGCLAEILLLPLELLVDWIFESWFSLMQWIIPEKRFSKKTENILKVIVFVFSMVLLVTFIIGMLAAALTEATVLELWKLTLLPLGISLVQIILGVIVRIVKRRKERKVNETE